MKIGIILRPTVLSNGKDIYICNNSFIKLIKKYNCIPLGITNMEGLKLVDKVIFQGGDMYNDFDMEAMKYCYDNDIPTLGVCLGMQTMGVLFNGEMLDFENNYHKSTDEYVHEVDINPTSKLYEILGETKIKVNSRHHSYISKTSLDVVGLCDTTIEAIEDKNKTFFIGLQWHPEDMVEYNKVEEKIFKYFFEVKSENKKTIRNN